MLQESVPSSKTSARLEHRCAFWWHYKNWKQWNHWTYLCRVQLWMLSRCWMQYKLSKWLFRRYTVFFNQNSQQDQGAYTPFWAVGIGFTTKKSAEMQTFAFLLWYFILYLYQNIGFLQAGICRDDRCVWQYVWFFFASIDLKIMSQIFFMVDCPLRLA